jgi:hypothetical protein
MASNGGHGRRARGISLSGREEIRASVRTYANLCTTVRIVLSWLRSPAGKKERRKGAEERGGEEFVQSPQRDVPTHSGTQSPFAPPYAQEEDEELLDEGI